MTWARLRRFHQQPEMIAAWLRLLGPLLRWLTPARRRLLLTLGAFAALIRYALRETAKTQRELMLPAVGSLEFVLAVGAVLAFVFLCFLAAKNFSQLPVIVRRHPQVCLHGLFWCLLAFAWVARPQSMLVACLIVLLPFVLWRVGYMLFTAQRGKMAGTRLRDHLFYIFPVWGGSDTPYGKGFDYLSANEARDEAALAKSQLAGVKCFLLAGIAAVAKALLAGCVFAEENVFRHTFGGLSPGLPRLGAMFATPDAYPVWLCWIALYAELLWSVLALAASGHVIIGWLRLFGFYVFRNTYKPLLAESIVEFWNRYYYYFKELLVNFFFYPTFTRHFKSSPRLRVFVAVFAAAFLGNMYYHWLRLDAELVAADFPGMWAALQSRLFYCLLLALGIYVSMQRAQRKSKGERAMPRRIVAIFGVWTFFSIIHIWAEKDPAPFVARMNFFLNLLGFA